MCQVDASIEQYNKSLPLKNSAFVRKPLPGSSRRLGQKRNSSFFSSDGFLPFKEEPGISLSERTTDIGRFPFTKKFGKFPLRGLGISVFEESVPFVTSPIRLQAPLRRFTKKPDALVNCHVIFSNASLFVDFPSNKWLLSACVVMRSLTSTCSHRSRFTVVETSPVNERTFQSCSCNILVFTRETCTGKESFKQARISTYHFYIRHICAAINFHDLALERGRQSTCSSPEVCLQNAYRNLTRISRHFLETRGSPGKPGCRDGRVRTTFTQT